MPPELITFFAAAIPYVDQKLAIPLGIKMGLSTTNAFLFSIAGSIFFTAIALALLSPITNFLCKNSKKIKKLIEKIFAKTRKEHSKKFERYGPLFIILFVAIPIPGSGFLSGSIVAFLFGVDYWKSLIIVSTGVVIAALLVTAGVESITTLISILG